MEIFELNNEQRRALALDEVECGWTKKNLSDLHWIYLDGNTIRKSVVIREDYQTKKRTSYAEYSYDMQTDDSHTFILPKTGRGKPRKLTASAMDNSNPKGVFLNYGSGCMAIVNYATQITYCTYDNLPSESDDLTGLEGLVRRWMEGLTDHDRCSLEAFRTAKRKHCKFEAGDFFRFRIDQHQWGFGRILFDVSKYRKDPSFDREQNRWFAGLMGKPLVIKVYHIISDTPDIDINDLVALSAFPSQPIFDNRFFYGEYEIIGNRELEQDEVDMPISFSSYIHDDTHKTFIYIQHGFIYRQLERNNCPKPIVALTEVGHIGTYDHGGVGFHLDIMNIPEIMRACVNKQSNDPYWDSGYGKNDLRNPKNKAIREQIFKAFGLNQKKSDGILSSLKRILKW